MVPWTHVTNPPPLNGISIASVVFVQLTRVPNTQTQVQTTLHAKFIAIGRIYVIAMRPNSTKWTGLKEDVLVRSLEDRASTSVFGDGRISTHADRTPTSRAILIGTRLR